MKPIIFSTEMVRAILDGKKTQTRRVIKPQPPEGASPLYGPEWFRPMIKKASGREHAGPEMWGIFSGPVEWRTKCPYQPGDLLYVREAWLEEDGRYFYRADYKDGLVDPCETLSGGYPSECRYYPECVGCQRTSWRPPWKPSIHMPRAAARLFLRVKDVRVERLQGITEDDARAESMRPDTPFANMGYQWSAKDNFREIWDRLNARRGFPWDANPWVWVVEFERTEGDDR